MKPQYVAGHSSSEWTIEASESQTSVIGGRAYLFCSVWPKLAIRFTHVGYTSRRTELRDTLVSLVRNSDRRLRCLRASNCWQYLALRSQRLLAHVKHRLKSLLWLIPRQSQLSRHIQVSTSNLHLGQAFAPAPTPRQHVHLAGGAVC